METNNETSFKFEYKKYVRQVAKSVFLFLMSLIVCLIAIALICFFYSRNEIDKGLLLYTILFITVAPIGSVVSVYAFILFLKQKAYCNEICVTINEEKQTISFYDGKKEVTEVVPFHSIRSVKYYSNSMTMAEVANYGGRSLLMEHLVVETKNGESFYLAFFPQFFKYLSDKEKNFPFPVEVQKLCFKHGPSSVLHE